jgi:hypothetical protein
MRPAQALVLPADNFPSEGHEPIRKATAAATVGKIANSAPAKEIGCRLFLAERSPVCHITVRCRRIAAILRDEGPWKNSAVLANSGGRAKSFRLAESLTRDLGKRYDAEAAGYACTRAAASLGVWDIISIGSTDAVLVSSQKHGIVRQRRNEALELIPAQGTVIQPTATAPSRLPSRQWPGSHPVLSS